LGAVGHRSVACDPMGSPTASESLPEGDAKVAAVRSMFDAIAPRYDLVNRIMTFRMDVGWRRRAVRTLGLRRGGVVLDLACGTGDLCRELAGAGLQPVGVDLSFGMLAAARTAAPLAQADALQLPFRAASVDGATCGFALRNLVALPPFFVELARVVRPGGRVALLEVAEPPNPLLRAGHRVYFGRVVPMIGGLLSDRSAYRYLPRSVAYLPAPADLLAQLAGAGFVDVERTLLSTGIAQLITATRRSPAPSDR
jgi:demethylmenaquinone methyltransferase / 2-methoxy-6-polyprenyl-1,4-benzoquinol methylase